MLRILLAISLFVALVDSVDYYKVLGKQDQLFGSSLAITWELPIVKWYHILLYILLWITNEIIGNIGAGVKQNANEKQIKKAYR